MTRSILAALVLAACSIPAAPGAGTDGGIPCPGPQCPCPCAPPLVCGPHGACTRTCSAPTDCSSQIDGETCLGGLCGVSCRPGGGDDCSAVGMAGSVCLTIQGTDVCGYQPHVTVRPDAADETGHQ